MQLLRTIKPEDVDPAAPPQDYSTYTSRPAVRAILFDGDKVALIHVRKHGYYMLPGGGIDKDENKAAALARELHEELGCDVSITDEIGSITIYNDRWSSKQTDYCYIANFIQGSSRVARTSFETEEGHEVVWFADLDQAIQHMRAATPENRDGKLVQARDLRFLEVAQQRLKDTSLS